MNDYRGTDTFTYTVRTDTNGFAASNPATVTVTVAQYVITTTVGAPDALGLSLAPRWLPPRYHRR